MWVFIHTSYINIDLAWDLGENDPRVNYNFRDVEANIWFITTLEVNVGYAGKNNGLETSSFSRTIWSQRHNGVNYYQEMEGVVNANIDYQIKNERLFSANTSSYFNYL